DARFLPNPFYVTELRSLTGLDAGVRQTAGRCGDTAGSLLSAGAVPGGQPGVA
ncbi:MAG: hypothetical protein K2H12_06235, partial [Acetatifactor sp.]|nr:hypothetical protein [Acetatifactor sp.]